MCAFNFNLNKYDTAFNLPTIDEINGEVVRVPREPRPEGLRSTASALVTLGATYLLSGVLALFSAQPVAGNSPKIPKTWHFSAACESGYKTEDLAENISKEGGKLRMPLEQCVVEGKPVPTSVFSQKLKKNKLVADFIGREGRTAIAGNEIARVNFVDQPDENGDVYLIDLRGNLLGENGIIDKIPDVVANGQNERFLDLVDSLIIAYGRSDYSFPLPTQTNLVYDVAIEDTTAPRRQRIKQSVARTMELELFTVSPPVEIPPDEFPVEPLPVPYDPIDLVPVPEPDQPEPPEQPSTYGLPRPPELVNGIVVAALHGGKGELTPPGKEDPPFTEIGATVRVFGASPQDTIFGDVAVSSLSADEGTFNEDGDPAFTYSLAAGYSRALPWTWSANKAVGFQLGGRIDAEEFAVSGSEASDPMVGWRAVGPMGGVTYSKDGTAVNLSASRSVGQVNMGRAESLDATIDTLALRASFRGGKRVQPYLTAEFSEIQGDGETTRDSGEVLTLNGGDKLTASLGAAVDVGKEGGPRLWAGVSYRDLNLDIESNQPNFDFDPGERTRLEFGIAIPIGRK